MRETPTHESFALDLHGLQYLCRVGVHVKARELLLAHRPHVSKGHFDRPAGFLECACVDAERDHPVPRSDELVSTRGETLPVTRERNQQIVDDGLRTLPGAAVVRE